MVADKPVTSTKVLAVLDVNVSVLAVLTTCKTLPPPAAAAHLSPVAVELSATKPAILQEQSQRIVLSLIAGVLHPRLYLGDLVGLGVGLLW
jgi:hypothetical protein